MPTTAPTPQPPAVGGRANLPDPDPNRPQERLRKRTPPRFTPDQTPAVPDTRRWLPQRELGAVPVDDAGWSRDMWDVSR